MKIEVIFSLFVGITVSLGGAFFLVLTSNKCPPENSDAHLKTPLKDFGTSTALYFIDSKTQAFPSSPKDMQLNPELTEKSSFDSWEELNKLNSKYFFFIYSKKKYTDSPTEPLLVCKNARPNAPNHYIVWEDGHVSILGISKTKELINSFRNNKPLEKMK